jgi:hypothetical protein
MVAGDGKADSVVNNDDKTITWEEFVGQSGFLPGDYNLDGHVDNRDKNDFWFTNKGIQSQVP